MYTLRFTNTFSKKFKKIGKNNKLIQKRVIEALDRLSEDPNYPGLRSHLIVHPMRGRVWSSRVTGDLIIIWNYDSENQLILLILDLGGHSGSQKVY